MGCLFKTRVLFSLIIYAPVLASRTLFAVGALTPPEHSTLAGLSVRLSSTLEKEERAEEILGRGGRAGWQLAAR